MRRATRLLAGGFLAALAWVSAYPASAETPDLIYKKTTVWKFLSPDSKIGTYGIDDPEVDGVACHFSVPEVGGWKG